MPYDPMLVQPMREELTRLGFEELATPEAVESWMNQKTGTSLLVMNSVCGCAAGSARPGVALSLEHAAKPERVATVFAGNDVEATQTASGFVPEVPPSSPSMYLFKDGELVYVMPRHAIEGRMAQDIAAELKQQFDKFCAPANA